MRRMWPEEFNALLDNAEVVDLEIPVAARDSATPGHATHRKALRVRLTQADFERVWPLAEARYRLAGKHAGKAITLVTTNPHYYRWHPADGGTADISTEGGHSYTEKYVVVHFLLDDVSEAVAA